MIDLSMKQGIVVEKGAGETTEPLDGDMLQIAGVLWEMGSRLSLSFNRGEKCCVFRYLGTHFIKPISLLKQIRQLTIEPKAAE
ncbi:hypothetical protein ACEQPO_05040 [Bacillus sp. SL00103]